MNKTEFADYVAAMPPKFHTIPGEAFDAQKSEVVAYLLKDDGVLNYLFQKARGTRGMVYNAETGQWTGLRYCMEIDVD